MKQKTHLRSESSDSEGHFNLCFFLGICSMDNERLWFWHVLWFFATFYLPLGYVLGLQHLW